MNELRERMLNTPESIRAFEEAEQEMIITEQLYQIRQMASLKQKDVASRMGISSPAVSRIENAPLSASIKTLEWYAATCGVKLSLSFDAVK